MSRVTIVSVASDNNDPEQQFALSSWLLLQPQPQVFLVGDAASTIKHALYINGLNVKNVVTLPGDAGTGLVPTMRLVSFEATNDLIVYLPSRVVVLQQWMDHLTKLAKHLDDCNVKSYLITGESLEIENVSAQISSSSLPHRQLAAFSSYVSHSLNAMTGNSIQYLAFNKHFLNTFTFPDVPIRLDGTYSAKHAGWPFWVARMSDEKNLAFSDSLLAEVPPVAKTLLSVPLPEYQHQVDESKWPQLQTMSLYKSGKFRPSTVLSCQKGFIPSRTVTQSETLIWFTDYPLEFTLTIIFWAIALLYMDQVIHTCVALAIVFAKNLRNKKDETEENNLKGDVEMWEEWLLQFPCFYFLETAIVLILSGFVLGFDGWRSALTFGFMGSFVGIDASLIHMTKNNQVNLPYSAIFMLGFLAVKNLYYFYKVCSQNSDSRKEFSRHARNLGFLFLALFSPPTGYLHVTYSALYWEFFAFIFSLIRTKIAEIWEGDVYWNRLTVLMLVEGALYFLQDYVCTRIFSAFEPALHVGARFAFWWLYLIAIVLMTPVMLNGILRILYSEPGNKFGTLSDSKARKGSSNFLSKVKRFFIPLPAKSKKN
eukprot:TRINITY_DN6390_c0_g1_i1.p1 TRINITY_DN6390_c0_g1~~TRINITY_DN6390_c0_g1_i1.p1  ORF type:complete len:611 (+),score=97.45 TRINITY_DN6390_c0_g1_i1:49-1833(+)